MTTIVKFFSELSLYITADPEKEKRSSWVTGKLAATFGSWTSYNSGSLGLRRFCSRRWLIRYAVFFVVLVVIYIVLGLINRASD